MELCSLASQAFILVFDQVENLAGEEIAALSRFCHALLDHATNLLVVTSGVPKEILDYKEQGSISSSSWERIARKKSCCTSSVRRRPGNYCRRGSSNTSRQMSRRRDCASCWPRATSSLGTDVARPAHRRGAVAQAAARHRLGEKALARASGGAERAGPRRLAGKMVARDRGNPRRARAGAGHRRGDRPPAARARPTAPGRSELPAARCGEPVRADCVGAARRRRTATRWPMQFGPAVQARPNGRYTTCCYGRAAERFGRHDGRDGGRHR